MSTAQFVRSRVDWERRSLGLLAGDTLAITAFAAVGATHHRGWDLPDPLHVGLVAIPFLLGWVLAAVLGGLYTRDATATPRRALSWTVPAWIVAALVGQAFRATRLFPGGTAPTFVLVTVAVGGLFVVGWRLLAAALVG